jgi:hypothetical protein
MRLERMPALSHAAGACFTPRDMRFSPARQMWFCGMNAAGARHDLRRGKMLGSPA